MGAPARLSIASLAITFVLGLGIRLLIDWANHHGPAGEGWSLRGNGALVFVPLAALVLIVAEVVAAIRRKWIDLLLLPLAFVLGLIAGGLVQL